MKTEKSPEFISFVGPMASGKTSSLLSYIDRCRYQKRNVMVFKPSRDSRYSRQAITTHGGWTVDANVVATVAEIYELISSSKEKPDVVAVDEAFMLEGIADALIWLFRQGITVVISSIDLSYTCKPFIEIQKILSWSTRVEKCTSVCMECGNDAQYTYKKVIDSDASSDDEIAVGGLDLYEPRCFLCHPLINEGD